MSGWRLLLTRPDEECAALAASLGEAGVHSSSLPLLAIDPLEETPEQRTLMLDLDRYCAVVWAGDVTDFSAGERIIL